MTKILVFDWAGAVKLDRYGFEHNLVIEHDLHELINFFLSQDLKVMVSKSTAGSDHDYLLCVDNKMFRQR